MLRAPGANANALTGELRLGASNTIGNYLVGELLGEFIRRHPDVSLKVSVENTKAIVTGVLEHRIDIGCVEGPVNRSEEHTSELQSLMRISYAVFCLKKKNNRKYTKI